jgi:hypothetical protein
MHLKRSFSYLPRLGAGLQTKALEKIVEKLHWAAAAILGFEALNFILFETTGFSLAEYLQTRISALANVYISKTSPLVPEFLLVSGFMSSHEIVIFLVILALLMFAIGRLRLDCSEKTARLSVSENGLRSHEEYLSAYERCEGAFHKLAYENAHRDAELFNALFVDGAVFDISKATYGEIQTRLSAIQVAIQIASRGLTNVMDAAKKLFDSMTGDSCAVCIQALENAEDDIEKADIETVIRDTESAAVRLNVYKQSLGANDLSKRIFIDLEPHVIENDLKTKLKSNNIRSSSYNIGSLYNAVCIVPVPVLGNKQTRPTASLCMDNIKGIPDDRREVCLHFAKELAWRAAVMQYRLVHLQIEKKKLEKALNDLGVVRWKAQTATL